MVGVEYLLAHVLKECGSEKQLSLVEGYVLSLIDQGILEKDYVRDDASISPLNETDNRLREIAEGNMVSQLDTSFIRAKVLDISRMEAALSEMESNFPGDPFVTMETYMVNHTPEPSGPSE